jgi:NitT/TauT family transport system substrate-binding protein
MKTQVLIVKAMKYGSTRTIVLTLIVIVAAVTGFIFFGNRRMGPDPGIVAKTEKIVINQAAKVLLYLPLYIAQHNGYFKAEGLEATVVTGGGDSQAFAAVVGGSADFGQGDPMMVPISRQRGGPGKIVGNVVGRVAFWGVAVDPKVTKIEKPQDFSGKRVVTYPAPMTIYALQKRNRIEGGLKPDDGSILQVQFGTELAPLFSGDADVTMTIEPIVSQALSKGARIVYSFPERYGDFTLTGIMVKEDLIQRSPDRVQHVLNAYQRALTYAHQNPDGAIVVAVKEFPEVEKAIIESAVRRMLEEETIPKNVTVSKNSYQNATAVRRDIGDLEKDIPFEEAVDNRFAEEAVRKYGAKQAHP